MKISEAGAVVVVALLSALIGCSTETKVDEKAVQPNQELRAAVERPAALRPPVPKHRFGYDSFGRLKRAEKLVNGFEVPLGSKLLKTGSSFIELSIKAPLPEVRDFYAGVDSKTGRRFAQRSYGIRDGKNGFGVTHTPTSLQEHGLDAKYLKGKAFITPDKNRRQRIRIHTVRAPVADSENPYIPRVNFESLDPLDKVAVPDHKPLPAPSAPSASAAGGDNPSASGSGGGGGPGSSGNPTAASKPTGAPSGPVATPDAVPKTAGSAATGGTGPVPSLPTPVATTPGSGPRTGGSGPKRWGPYGPSQKRDPKPAIREWLKQNPGKVFLD
ncbi:MAG: hypothetical protein ACI9WU_001540 [Myxococcota bacterium]